MGFFNAFKKDVEEIKQEFGGVEPQTEEFVEGYDNLI